MGNIAGGALATVKKNLGTGWPPNYLLIPGASRVTALLEMLGFPGSPPSESGYIERNAEYFSPEVVSYFKTWLPYDVANVQPADRKDIPFPSPNPATSNETPFITGAKSVENFTWDNFLADVQHSVHAQAFDILSTYYQREAEHLEALNRELDHGDGRLALKGTGGTRGIGGQDIGRNVIQPGDVKLAAEVAGDAIVKLAETQDPAVLSVTSPDAPLPSVFAPSPQPPRSAVIRGGSNAASQAARSLGLLPAADPFSPLLNVPPDVADVYRDNITDRLRNIFDTAGSLSDLFDRFGPSSGEALLGIFDGPRLLNLLGQGGGTSPIPNLVPAKEHPNTPTNSAQRDASTVRDAARLLGLPTSEQWIIGLSPAQDLYGIRGTNAETGQRVTLGESMFPRGTNAWVVRAGNEAVFVSDTSRTAVRLRDVQYR
ncbi:MAG: hypothetical protein G01um1014106_159 [Parcubacteria group bacterium Gr01-1014_106]|nr:MAG: hypothetical protein G01um1014106_159 [Parcubacteria group bacterium Gr01-1014_106]